ncbi:MAG: HD domain-containing protein [Lachnospiraceae bacterium]|nr:HD domain-containing protein [Lachnospiraceae bacterium]
MKKKGMKNVTFMLFALTLLAIIGIYLFAAYRFYQDVGKPLNIEIDNGTEEESVGDGVFRVKEPKEEETEEQDLEVTLECVEGWTSQKTDKSWWIGGKYEGVIKNNLDRDFYDWKLVIQIPEGMEITFDSTWNGTYEIQGSQIVLTPDESIYLIPRKDSRTFGFVIYCEKKPVFSQFNISGHKYGKIIWDPLFITAIWASIIWVTCLVAYLIVRARLRSLELRRIHDEEIIDQTMHMFAEMIDAKDSYTRQHSARVSLYSKKIAENMGMSEDEIRRIGYISLMHDCGKIGIPDAILTKPGSLNESERTEIEKHTEIGARFLEKITSIEGICDGARCHHERYDGTGYPNHLKGEEIPLYARIIGIADAFDAMNSDRVYRKRLPKEIILRELSENAGTQFDPDIVKHMIQLIETGKVLVGEEQE